jgi:hypothetical protein
LFSRPGLIAKIGEGFMKFCRTFLPVLIAVGAITGMSAILVAALPQDMPPLPASPTQNTTPPPAPKLSEAPPPAAAVTPPAQGQPQEPVASPTASTAALAQAQLDQLLAPIALYPDQLLSQVLMASTYPLEIAEAARWINAPGNRSLNGEALTKALQGKHWDPSVMALVAFPDVLQIMCARLEWTDKLGDAFLAQQTEVMDAVQRLRQEAIAAGTFKSGPQCGCVVETSNDIVTVSPASVEVVYVPVYNPVLVYGTWPYPLYPPVAFPLPVGFAFSSGFSIGFGAAVHVAFYGPLWGWSSFNWGAHTILVDPVRVAVLSRGRVRVAGAVWVHDPARSRVFFRIDRIRTAAFRTIGRGSFAGYRGPGFGPGFGFRGGPTHMAMGGWPGRGGGGWFGGRR